MSLIYYVLCLVTYTQLSILVYQGTNKVFSEYTHFDLVILVASIVLHIILTYMLVFEKYYDNKAIDLRNQLIDAFRAENNSLREFQNLLIIEELKKEERKQYEFDN